MVNSLWKKATFTVPSSVPHERVMAVSDKYMSKLGRRLELLGWEVLQMTKPVPIKSLPYEDTDRKKYAIMVLIRKAPTILDYEVPDKYVPTLLQRGWTLKE